MVKAMRIHEHGGPEIFRFEEIDVGEPGPDEVRIRHTAIALNFRDTYHRAGTYPIEGLPQIIGGEAAGVIEAVGSAVEGFFVGQRVCYGSGPMGAYAEARLIPARFVLALPDSLDETIAAAMMVKGMTARYLLLDSYRVSAGETILIQAVAGGVGLILCQWAKHLGATVIGTAGSEEKAAWARAHGCDHVINYRTEDFPARVRELTGGAGVPVVYDGVGKDTFAGSIDSLAPNGTLVGYGNASGNFPMVDPYLLMLKGSLHFARTALRHFIATRRDLERSAADLFAMVETGHIRIDVNQTYPLAEAAQAHRDIEARKTMGSTVLLP